MVGSPGAITRPESRYRPTRSEPTLGAEMPDQHGGDGFGCLVPWDVADAVTGERCDRTIDLGWHVLARLRRVHAIDGALDADYRRQQDLHCLDVDVQYSRSRREFFQHRSGGCLDKP